MENKIKRREFIKRLTKTGAAVGITAAGAYLTLDRKGPGGDEGNDLVSYPDFSVAGKQGQVLSVAKGPDRKETVRKAIELLGGMDRFIEKGDTVAIKPNVAFATPAMLCATTNPDLIVEVVKLCYKAGAKEVIVTDNPINDPSSCFTLSGIGSAVEKTQAKVILPKQNLFKNTTLDNGKLIVDWPVFFEPFANIDKIIGITPVKDHHRSEASMTMKNWYGLLGGRRNIFHQDINRIISELSQMIKPTFVILDGTQSMITNGPTGGSLSDLRQTNTMIASTDMVAADTFGAGLLDLKVKDLPYLRQAVNAGVGTTDIESLKPKIAEAGLK